MQVRFLHPLENGFNRMKTALFRPFDLGKWFVVGFTAFLAHLSGGSAGRGGGSKYANPADKGDWDIGNIVDAPDTVIHWLQEHTGYAILILFGIILVIGIIILLTWLSSRGKFMFLHNVAGNRSEVTKPWHEYAREGNSVLFWSLGFGLICFLIMVGFGVAVYNLLCRIDAEGLVFLDIAPEIVGLGLLLLLYMLVTAYVLLFLNDFIVPVMYRNRISAIKAWQRFMKIFAGHPLQFLFYGLIIVIIYMLIGALYITAGVFTCCIGFIFLVLPYISSVVTLPVSYTLRAFSAEFLAQFGGEFNVFKTAGKEKKRT